MRAHRLGSNGSAQRTSSLTAQARLTRTALATALLVALGIAAPAHAANFTVRSAADSGPDTLRQAVLDANATGGGHHNIHFALPAGSTITLTSGQIALTSGQIALTGPDITMQGPGQNALTISGNHQSRIFDVEAGSLTLSDMTLRDGLAQGDATNFYDQVGGAIRVGALPPPMIPAQFSARLAEAQRQATVAASGSGRTHRSAGVRAALQALSQSVVTGVPAPGLTLDHVQLARQPRRRAAAVGWRRCVFASGDATLVVHNSLFNNNSTSWIGGAICALGGEDVYSLTSIGNFDVADTTIIANHIDQNGAGPGAPGQGAGIIIYGPGGSIRRTVFRDNIINDAPADQPSEGVGGALNLGLFGGKPITITDSEISGNTIVLRPGVFSEGAGLYCVDYAGYGTPLTITNTTISGNQSGTRRRNRGRMQPATVQLNDSLQHLTTQQRSESWRRWRRGRTGPRRR